MFPRGDKVWFFKVMGPEPAISTIADPFRSFVESVSFSEEGPFLATLPAGWRRAADKPMRFASISVETPEKQLDISISSLSLQEDWDQQVIANVNRWRGQLELENSDEPLAGGEPLVVESSDGKGVWVDFVGDPSTSSPSMLPPFANRSKTTKSDIPPVSPTVEKSEETLAANDDPRIQYSRPDGWRAGRASSMRLASFSVGPEDSAAEMTVIVAGGDLRGNVSRWIGQVMEKEIAESILDETLEAAERIQVDGRDAQRFYLVSELEDSQAIDGTIVPLGPDQSVFIKMTGPSRTVESQKNQISDFIKSLSLNF